MPIFSSITHPVLRLLCELVTYSSLFFCLAVQADVIVVTRSDTELETVNSQQLSALWLKQSIYIGETAVEVIDLPENHPARKQFYSRVVGKTGNKLSAFWAKQVFRGNGFPPTTGDSQAAVIQWLKDSKNRLAYINDGTIDKSLKIIYRLTELKSDQDSEN